MSAPVAVVSDCRGTAPIDREAVAAALDTDQTIVTNSLAAHRESVVERIAEFDHERVLLVAGDDPVRADLRETLRNAGIQTAVVSPYLGSGHTKELATAVVAGAANAALAGMAAREAFVSGSIDPDETVAVVGEPAIAADLADVAEVTLVADGADLAHATLPEAVEVVAGRPNRVTHLDSGYGLTVEHRVTADCTGCGQCLRAHPEQTTDVPVQVVTDAPIETVCPVGAIRPAEDPATHHIEPDQIVWPDYDGDLADTIWMHTERDGVAARVRRAARMRGRTSVSVEGETCAVGTNGQPGCSACEEACPNDAISISTDFDGGVHINPDRCVACGTCVSTCPTASIKPTRTFDVETFADVVQAGVAPLLEQRDSGSRSLLSRGSAPTPFAVAFVSSGIAPALKEALVGRTTPPVVPIVVPNVLHVPDAVAEYAVALGADGVLLASDPEKPTEPVADTVRSANRALADLGVGERVDVSETASADDLAETLNAMVPDEAIGAVETGSVSRDSRHALGRDATVALVDGHAGGAATVAAPGAGEVTVTAAECTLCNTCDNLCPTDALSQAEGVLEFEPEACVGCGLCEAACPEDAISVTETLSVESGSIGDTQRAVEKTQVECSVCGERFASQAGINAIRERLDEQSLEALDLEVCPSCRSSGGTHNDVRIPR